MTDDDNRCRACQCSREPRLGHSSSRERPMCGYVLVVGEHRLKVDTLLSHFVVPHQQPHALKGQQAREVTPGTEKNYHSGADDPPSSLENEWEEHDAGVKLGNEERVEALFEYTSAKDF